MKNSTLITSANRIILIVCSLALAAVIFLPIWRIELDAAQYPEGLELQIYSNKLAGNVEIINGLNHYIGMKTLHADDFIEFTILPYLIGFFTLSFLAVAISGKRKWVYVLFAAFLLFGIVAMVDFYRWLYDYGHDLDPNAPIIVPGMAYQPPLIGFKQLLNFGAFSIPDIGGWIFIGVGILVAYCTGREIWLAQETKQSFALLAFCVLIGTQACTSNAGPQPIKYGKDQCVYCKMTISDARFGTQLVTKKGRAYNFDDVQCMIAYVEDGDINREDIAAFYLPDFNTSELKPAEAMFYLKSEALKSPMRGDIAAFVSKNDMEETLKEVGGTPLTWDDLWE